MKDNDLFTLAIAMLGATLLGLWMIWPDGRVPTNDNDGPGPNLILQMGGRLEGLVAIDLDENLAPQNVERIVDLAESGAYKGIAFHRVIDGFMAQTGDVEFGKMTTDLEQAGYGSSGLPPVPAEFSDIPFVRGLVGMARGPSPDSADSQFFIVLQRAPNLDGQYTVVGQVVAGMDLVDQIAKGDPDNGGKVEDPDFIIKAWIED